MLHCISVNHMCSSKSKDDASVDPLDMVGQVLQGVEGISTQATGKCVSPQHAPLSCACQTPSSTCTWQHRGHRGGTYPARKAP